MTRAQPHSKVFSLQQPIEWFKMICWNNALDWYFEQGWGTYMPKFRPTLPQSEWHPVCCQVIKMFSASLGMHIGVGSGTGWELFKNRMLVGDEICRSTVVNCHKESAQSCKLMNNKRIDIYIQDFKWSQSIQNPVSPLFISFQSENCFSVVCPALLKVKTAK